MNFIDFKSSLAPYIVFSLKDVQQLYPVFQRLQLTRWQKKGYLNKIIKGYYLFSDLQRKEETLFLIANKIYTPSYISLEIALSYYGFIPDNVYTITSTTSRTTYTFISEIGNFTYQKIKSSLFWGYTLVSINNHNFKIAEPEKALLDYFYLNSHLKQKEDFEEMRFNLKEIQDKINLKKFNQYLAMFQNKALSQRVDLFLNYLKA